MYAIFIPFSKLCLALRLSVFCGSYVGHWVCLFFGWETYVWHYIYLLFVGVVLCIWFVCYFVGGLMFGNGCYLEKAQLINCFWNILVVLKSTGY